MTDFLKNSIFSSETRARAWLEARVWPRGPVCPHCGNTDENKITHLEGEAHRQGLYQCNKPECRLQITVTVGTVLERSKIPLLKWLSVLSLMTASQKRVSAHQIDHMLSVMYKSALFIV